MVTVECNARSVSLSSIADCGGMTYCIVMYVMYCA